MHVLPPEFMVWDENAYGVEYRLIHPRYMPGNSFHDFGLLELDRILERFTDEVHTVLKSTLFTYM